MPPFSPQVQALLQLALQEDGARQDITTRTLIPATLRIEAEIRTKQNGVICGLGLAQIFFQTLDRRAQFVPRVRDGQIVKPGQTLARIQGNARAILSAERPALNILQHLSGIATYTRQQVDRVRSRKTRIYDTRKTIPGLRELEKYAVRCGGGVNHRMTLRSAFLIKDNHLKICRLAGVDWKKSLQAARKRSPGVAVELEIQTERDLKDALTLRPDQLLLDNMSRPRLKSMIRTIRKKLPGTAIEISGGVKSEQIPSLSRLNVERISMGKLTHSAPALDIHLDILRVIHSR